MVAENTDRYTWGPVTAAQGKSLLVHSGRDRFTPNISDRRHVDAHGALARPDALQARLSLEPRPVHGEVLVGEQVGRSGLVEEQPAHRGAHTTQRRLLLAAASHPIRDNAQGVQGRRVIGPTGTKRNVGRLGNVFFGQCS